MHNRAVIREYEATMEAGGGLLPGRERGSENGSSDLFRMALDS